MPSSLLLVAAPIMLSPLLVACYTLNARRMRLELPRSPIMDFSLSPSGQSATVAVLLGLVDAEGAKIEVAGRMLGLLRREGFWRDANRRTSELDAETRWELICVTHAQGSTQVAELLRTFLPE